MSITENSNGGILFYDTLWKMMNCVVMFVLNWSADGVNRECWGNIRCQKETLFHSGACGWTVLLRMSVAKIPLEM